MFCALVMVGSFVTFRNDKLAKGAILQDHTERLSTIRNTRSLISLAASLPGNNVIAVGSLEQLTCMMPPEKTAGTLRFSGVMTQADLASYLKQHFAIYYLPLIREYVFRVNGIDLARYGARDLRVVYSQSKTDESPKQ